MYIACHIPSVEVLWAFTGLRCLISVQVKNSEFSVSAAINTSFFNYVSSLNSSIWMDKKLSWEDHQCPSDTCIKNVITH